MTEPVAAPHMFELSSFSHAQALPPPPPTMRPTDPGDVQWTAPFTRLSGELTQMINTQLVSYERPISLRPGAMPGSGPESRAADWELFMNAQRLSMQELLKFQVGMSSINVAIQTGLKFQSSIQKAVNQLLTQQGA